VKHLYLIRCLSEGPCDIVALRSPYMRRLLLGNWFQGKAELQILGKLEAHKKLVRDVLSTSDKFCPETRQKYA
jgi:hypothetical protein